MKAFSLPPLLVLFLLCLSIPLILFTSFSLSLPPSKHHNFLISTYEFILVVKSNRVAVFFMFNVIIITIVLGSFRPFINGDLEWCHDDNDAKKEDEENDHNEECGCDYFSDLEEGDNNEYFGSDGYDEDEDDDGSHDDVDSDEFFGEEKDSDLERRSEDFIAKVTRKWREELVYEKLMFMASMESQSSTSS